MGVVVATSDTMHEEKLLEELLDYDINDIKNDGSRYSIYCAAKSLDTVKHQVEKLGMKVESADIEWVAKTATALPEDQATKAYEFLEALDEHEDIKNVYTNLE